MKTFRMFLLTGAAAMAAGSTMADDGLKVVTSIKPVYSLASALTEGTGTNTTLLVKGAASPHTYSMAPSEARALEQADVIFWIGPSLEHFLEKPLTALGANAEVVELEEAPGVETLAPREGGAFEAHAHEHDEHADGDEHDHDADDGHEDHDHADHDHADHADHADHDDDHGHEGHDEAEHHHDGEVDPHMWLDPENAKAFAAEMTQTLVAADPENTSTYEANLAKLDARLDKLTTEITGKLAEATPKPYVVFHDAYHYYGHRFGTEAAGSITVNPEAPPSAARIREIQEKLVELGTACVFSEPQFPPKVINVVIEGTDTYVGTLDPLGADLTDGPDLYFELLNNMTDGLVACFNAA